MFLATSETKRTPNICQTCSKHIPNMSNTYPKHVQTNAKMCSGHVQHVSRKCPTNVQHVTLICRNISKIQAPGTLVIVPRGSCRWGPSATFKQNSLLVVPLCAMLCPGSLPVGPGSLVVVESSTPARDPPAARQPGRRTEKGEQSNSHISVEM